MTSTKTILVPSDFSEASRHALEYACTIADVSGASIEVFHSVETPYLTGGYTEMYVAPPDYLERAEASVRAELGRLLTPEQVEKYRVTFVLRIGAPAHELLQYVNQRPDIDLIVMATHGRGGVARLMLGSVADKVVRSAPCPVVTIREGEVSRERQTHRAA